MEEEFLLVDPDDGRPRPVAAALLDSESSDPVEHGVEHELQLQQIETSTKPCTSAEELTDQIHGARRHAAAVAEAAGARVVALGTSPVSVHAQLYPSRRYRKMAERFGMTAQEQLSCGCHVHVQIQSPDEGVGVLDRIRPWMAVLLALSANSPYWQGDDSAYASYRSQVWVRWPSAGPTELFGSARAYRARVAAMLDTDTILDEGMVYFDARLSRTYPTVEIRVADVCMQYRDAVLIGLLCRAMVDTAARDWANGAPAPEIPVELLKLATWRAGRCGIDSELVDPRTGRPASAERVVRGLIDHLEESLRESGDLATTRELAADLLARGNGARRQRADFAASRRLEDIVLKAVDRTVAP